MGAKVSQFPISSFSILRKRNENSKLWANFSDSQIFQSRIYQIVGTPSGFDPSAFMKQEFHHCEAVATPISFESALPFSYRGSEI